MAAVSPRRAAFPWSGGRPPHLPCGPGDVAPVVLLPGDPARIGIAERMFPAARGFGQRREFRAATLDAPDGPVTLCSTGIGGPSTEIALVELAGLGARTAIRIGGMGRIGGALPLGGLLIVTRAIGGTGTARAYGAADGAEASPEVVAALAGAAAAAGVPHALGCIATTDSYYLAQGRPLRAAEAAPDPAALARFADAGAQGCDMETEAVFAVGRRLGLAVGAILAVHGDRVTDQWLEDYEPAQEHLLRVALVAARSLTRTPQPQAGDLR